MAVYTQQTWVDNTNPPGEEPSAGATQIVSSGVGPNLTHIEQGVYAASVLANDAVPGNNLSAFGIFLPEQFATTGTTDDHDAIQAANDAAKAAGGGVVYLTKMYNPTTTINPTVNGFINVPVTTGDNFSIAIAGVAPGGHALPFYVEIQNSSGGAMGTITWPSTTTFVGTTWTNPASGKKRLAHCVYLGTGSVFLIDFVSNDY